MARKLKSTNRHVAGILTAIRCSRAEFSQLRKLNEINFLRARIIFNLRIKMCVFGIVLSTLCIIIDTNALLQIARDINHTAGLMVLARINVCGKELNRGSKDTNYKNQNESFRRSRYKCYYLGIAYPEGKGCYDKTLLRH